jgi:hypothetical protein
MDSPWSKNLSVVPLGFSTFLCVAFLSFNRHIPTEKVYTLIRKQSGFQRRITREIQDAMKIYHYLQNSPQKIEDCATRTPIKTRGAPEGLAVPAPLVTPVVKPLNDQNINKT